MKIIMEIEISGHLNFCQEGIKSCDFLDAEHNNFGTFSEDEEIYCFLFQSELIADKQDNPIKCPLCKKITKAILT